MKTLIQALNEANASKAKKVGEVSVHGVEGTPEKAIIKADGREIYVTYHDRRGKELHQNIIEIHMKQVKQLVAKVEEWIDKENERDPNKEYTLWVY